MSPLLVVLLSVLPLLTHQQCWAPPDTETSNNANTHHELSAGQHAFSFELLKQIVDDNKEESVFFSPLSIYKALILAYFGSAAHTETDLKRALHLPPDLLKSEVMKAFMFEKLLKASRRQNDSTTQLTTVSNHLFFANYLKLKDCIAIVFSDEVSMMNFASDPEAARTKINEWIEDQTVGHIKDMVKEGQIQRDSQIVLVNTAYFKGEWESGFKNVKQDKFHVSVNESVNVTMMRQTGQFSYYISDDYASHILELPYKGESVSMYIMMPKTHKINDTCGVDFLIEALNPEVFQTLIETLDMATDTLIVGIPKFSIKKSLELTPILERLGVGDLFRSTADLSDFTGDSGITLDEAQHVAKIEVDERGTTAAAATMMFGTRSSRPSHQKFIANKPFVYFLYNKIDKTVLFTGVFRSPVA